MLTLEKSLKQIEKMTKKLTQMVSVEYASEAICCCESRAVNKSIQVEMQTTVYMEKLKSSLSENTAVDASNIESMRGSFFEAIKDGWSSVQSDSTTAVDAMTTGIDKLRDAIEKNIKPGEIKNGMVRAQSSGVEASDSSKMIEVAEINNKISLFYKEMENRWKTIKQGFDTALNWIKGQIDNSGKWAKDKVGGIYKKIAVGLNIDKLIINPLRTAFTTMFSSIKSLFKTFSGVAASLWKAMPSAAASFKGLTGAGSTLKAGMTVTDDFVSSQIRLGQVNDGSQTSQEFQDMIFASAERSRSDYMTIADSVSKLGSLAGNSFSGNEELVAFAELMQKGFQASGASEADQQSGIEQLTKAMAAGKLQGEEFRELTRTAPLIAEAIANYTGKSISELAASAEEGEITAATIRAAMFTSAEDINSKFAEMPLTFGQIASQFQNAATQAFAPLMTAVSEALQSEPVQQFLTVISNGLHMLGDAAVFVFGLLVERLDVVVNVLIAVGIVLAALAIHWLITWITAAWPILAIVAAITAVLFILNKLGVSTQEIVGFIMGIFHSLFAMLWNSVAYMYNLFISFAEFLANLFIDPVYAIKKLFYDMLKRVTDYIMPMINMLIDGVNKLLKLMGSDFSMDRVNADWVENLKPESDKDVVNLDKYRMQAIDIAGAFDKGYSRGADLVSKADGALGNLWDNFKWDTASGVGGNQGLDTINRVGEVGKINNSVDVSSEDIKVMRDLAEMKEIQNFVTLTPTVQVTTGNIMKEVDVETMIRQIEQSMEREIAAAAEGIYE